jgi:ketosteroid isomerase-like protein
MSTDASRETEKILKHHMDAVSKSDVDTILGDYTEDSVLFAPEGPMHGLVEIRAFFEGFFDSLSTDFMDDFVMMREDVEGEIAYILWAAEPYVSMGTDTFIVRNGKIAVQTFAAG